MEDPSREPANHLPMEKSDDFLLLFPVCPRILVGIKNKPKDRWFHVQVQVQALPTAPSKGTSMRTGACLTPDLCPTEHQPDEQRTFIGVLQCPSTEEWIKKVWHIYTMEYCSSIKKNETMPFAATWVKVEIMMLSEVSQTEKDKYHMILLLCGIQKKIQMNLQSRHRKRNYGYQKGSKEVK